MASEDKDYKQSALGQRVNELMDDGYEFGEAVKQAMSEGLKDGGSVGIEILFGPKVPAAPSQLVSESDILLGYRGDAAYRSGSEQSKSIGQGNVGSKASFGGGQGVDRSGRSEGAGGVNPNQYTSKQQNVNNIKAQLGIKDPNLLQKTFNKYNSLPFGVKGAINTMAPVELMKLFQVGNVLNTGYNQLKKPILTEEDITLEPGKLPELTLGMIDNPLPSENLLADATTTPTSDTMGLNLMDRKTLKDAGYSNSQIQELQNNPDINTQDVIRDIKGPIFAAADGGRVGFFMGGPALEGEALSIYNSMSAYGNTDQQIADKLQSLGMYTPGGSTPDAPDQGIINQQLNQGGGDGPKGDFGIFGNLLKDTAKEFNVQTYDEELGDFIDTKITGYKNVNSGLYQDKFGKNLQPAFSNKGQAFGLSGIIAQALGLTPDTVGGYVPGSIKGKYDGITDMFGSLKNFKFKNPFNFFKNQQATNAEIAAANLKAKQELDAKLAAEAAAAALQQQMQDTGVTGSNYNQAANIAGGGGGNTATYGGQTAREATYDNDKSTGTSQGYSQHYARGGLATMFTRRR